MRRAGLGQWRAGLRARAPGWGERSPGFLCVSGRADLPVRRQITAPARAFSALPGPPGPCAGCAGRLLPASPRLPLAAAGLSPPSPSVSLSPSTDYAAARPRLSARLSPSPRPAGAGTAGFGGEPFWDGLRPSGVSPCVFCKSVSPSPSPDSPLPLPLLQSIRNISCLAVKKKDVPRMLPPTHRAGDPEAKWPILGPRRPSPERASEASVPLWLPELAWVVVGEECCRAPGDSQSCAAWHACWRGRQARPF